MPLYTGTSGNDTITGSTGADTILGGGGNDVLSGGRSADLLDGGDGSDTLEGGAGADIFVYRLGDHIGAADVYRGGAGVDRLRLELTAAEWADPLVRQQLLLYRQHLDAGNTSSFTLTLRGNTLQLVTIEQMDIVVDGSAASLNDPFLRSGDVAGAIVEDAIAATLVDSGTYQFGDLQLSDVHTLGAVRVATPLGGRLTASITDAATGDGTGTVSWSYRVANSATQYLAAGQTVDEVFRVTVRDAAGGTFGQEVRVTVTGVNDGPTAAAPTGNFSVTETESPGTLSAAGSIAFADVDLADAHTVTVVAAGGNTLGGQLVATVADAATGDGAGRIDWVYQIDNAAAAFLGAGQTAVETFTVTVSDGQGSSAARQITVTVVGIDQNQAPQAGTGSGDGIVAEDDAPVTLAASGHVDFTDANLADTHDVLVTPAAGNALGGALVAAVTDAATGDGAGRIGWAYTLNNAAVQALGAGQAATETFTLRLADNRGAFFEQAVTVTVEGRNDAAAIDGTATAALAEDDAGGAGSVGGTLAVTDADADEAAMQPVAAGTVGSAGVGSFTVSANGSWAYLLDNALPAVQALAEGAVLTDTLLAWSLDGTASRLLEVTITGTNDQAEIGGQATGRIVRGTDAAASGVLAVADADDGEALLQPVAAGTPGSGGWGRFTVAADGSWSYALDTSLAAVQGLAAGDTLVDTILLASADGTATRQIDVTIEGSIDGAAIGGTASASVAEDTTPAAGGVLTVTDGTPGQSALQPVAAGTPGLGGWGTFEVAADGTWSYLLDNTLPAVQALAGGQTQTDSLWVASADGSATRLIEVLITGANDDAAIDGIDTATVAEDDTAAVGGQLVVTDVDAGEAVLQAVAAGTAGSQGLGTFAVGADGTWAYTLDNTLAAVQALGAGATAADQIIVTSADGTATRTLAVTIVGVNDAAVLGGTTAAGVAEDGTATAGGTVTVADADAGQSQLQAVPAGTLGSLGLGSFDVAADGSWSYLLDNLAPAVQALGEGDTLIDTLSVASADGSASVLLEVSIAGNNDAATIDGTASGTVTEDGPAVTSGVLTVADIDAGEAALVPVAAGTLGSGGYGSFTVAANGTWSYVLDNAAAAVQALGAGATLTDTLQVASADGSATRLVTVTIQGAADRPDVDLTLLSPSRGFIIQGDAPFDYAGASVSAAGDVNGDGFDDVIVGAFRGDGGGNGAGEAYVVFGGAGGFGAAAADGRQVLELASLAASQGFMIQGDEAWDYAGRSVAAAGDLNGDGLADLIVGAPRNDDGGNEAGAAYVIYGRTGAFGGAGTQGSQVVDTDTLAPAQGVVIRGAAANGYAGHSVASAGDIDGDGFDDLLIGAPQAGAGGRAYVVLGSADGIGQLEAGRQVLDLATLGPAQGFVIAGAAYDQAGFSVSAAGDINGDGFGDLIVGAYGASGGGSYAGAAYVVFGGAGGFGTEVGGQRVLDLAALAPAQGFVIQGDAAGDYAGVSVASAGDVNGDSLADLVVGAFNGDDGGPNAGEAYVVFGRTGGFGTDVGGRQTIDLTTLAPADGFVIRGDARRDFAGASVAGAGDVNGDGFDDLIVGAYGGDDGGSYAGEAYVIFGTDGGFGTDIGGRQVLDLTNLPVDAGFIVRGDAEDDLAGISVSAAGDINRDGFADLIVGAEGGDDGGDDGGDGAGEAYVLFGGAFGAPAVPVAATGTAAADTLAGGIGSDTLAGGGGADVLRAGAGDDLLVVADAAWRLADGGGGQDRLALAGDGLVLDFTASGAPVARGIESIDLTGSAGGAGNRLVLDADAVFDFSSTVQAAFTAAGGAQRLVIDGDAGDTVGLALGGAAAGLGWARVASDVGLDGAAGGAYHLYALGDGVTQHAWLAVGRDVIVDNGLIGL